MFPKIFLKNIKFNFFSKIFLFFIILAILVLTISILTTQYYLLLFKKQAEDKYNNTLKILKDTIDSKITNSLTKILYFTWDARLTKLRASKNPLKDFPDGYKILDKSNIFGLDLNNSLISSFFYLHGASHTVIGNHYTINESDFFSYHFIGINRNSFKFYFSKDPFFIPETIKFRINEKHYTNVIPFFIPDRTFKGNYIFLLISEEAIFYILKNSFNNNFINSNLMIIDSTGLIRSQIRIKNSWQYKAEEYPQIKDNKFLTYLNSKSSFRYKLYGEKCLIIRIKSSRSGFKNIYYVLSIPYDNIYKQALFFRNISLIISILTLFTSLIISFIMSKNLYNPLKKIISLFKPNALEYTNDEFNFISQNVKKLFNDREKLSQSLTSALPIISENYLYNLLNKDSKNIEQDIIKILRQKNITFKYPNFSVALSRLYFTGDFYEKFNREDQLQLLNQIYHLFKNAFPPEFVIFILTTTQNEFCIIINLENVRSINTIVKSIKNIHKVYELNQYYLNIYTGIGRIHFGYKGLKNSYDEANKSLNSLSQFSNKDIKVYESESENINYQYYSTNEENQLINYLQKGYKIKSIKLLNNIIKRIQLKNISNNEQINQYLKLFNLGMSILNKKNMHIKDIMKDHYLDIYNEYKKMNNYEILNYIIFFFETLTCLVNINNRRKLNINEIIDYINKNYIYDISLEKIASNYNTSIQHLSRVLKKSLNMNFQQYINNLRIKKAKYLLKNTIKNVELISIECGYNTRYTFMRMFKILEGITPTEYRYMEINKIN